MNDAGDVRQAGDRPGARDAEVRMWLRTWSRAERVGAVWLVLALTLGSGYVVHRLMKPSCAEVERAQAAHAKELGDALFGDVTRSTQTSIGCGGRDDTGPAMVAYDLPHRPRSELTALLRQAGWSERYGGKRSLMTSPDGSVEAQYGTGRDRDHLRPYSEVELYAVGDGD
jgi:hypothetical protein